MPRKPDPRVEQRILDAAEKLLHRGGEKALSMRKVATLAGTNTPAVYRRFRNKNEILQGLVRRNQEALFEVLRPCSSFSEVGERALKFALEHRREYELLTSGLMSKVSERRPNVEFMMQKSAEWLGGDPEDHEALVIALWSLMHGTAMLLISETISPRYAAGLRATYAAAVEVLVSHANHFIL
ncbi:MAG TPA: helix-turn-helix domain-containing protein [Terriglobales bacterium]|nr:helix-turn-helix domain-containing protein [Terriglobales bacterium]